MRSVCVPVLALLVCHAGSVGPDNGPDTEFPYVGYYGGLTAVAVGPNLVLTADHCGIKDTFDVDTTTRTKFRLDASSRRSFPEFDLALIRTYDPLPGWYEIEWEPLGVGEQAEEIRIVGYGATARLRGDGVGYEQIENSQGQRRQGTGLSLARVGPESHGYKQVQMLMSGITGPGSAFVLRGDSGGGWFVRRDGEWKLVGISLISATAKDATALGFPVGNRIQQWSGAAELAALEDWLRPEIEAMTASEDLSILLALSWGG